MGASPVSAVAMTIQRTRAMTKFVAAVVVIISAAFLLTGGARALVAFWFIIGIILLIALIICGLDSFLKRKKMV